MTSSIPARKANLAIAKFAITKLDSLIRGVTFFDIDPTLVLGDRIFSDFRSGITK